MNLKSIRTGIFCILCMPLFLGLSSPSFANEILDSAKEAASETAKAIEEGATKFGEFFDDASITTIIKSKYVQANGLDSFDISVETIDGIVVLSGQVDNQAQASLAEELAKNVDGVRKVVNTITVKK